LLTELKKSDTYDKFFAVFMSIYKDPAKREEPESYLDFESSLKKYIEANPHRTADTKAKASQYFTILNRIEYVIELNAKYSEPSFLFFWRKFNMLYNMLHRSEDIKDPIEVYFDNQIGIVEVIAEESIKKKNKLKEVALGKIPGPGGQFDILSIIAARNEQEAKTGTLIKDFEAKIVDFFRYVRNSSEGERLIVKIKSHVSENEIYGDFAKIYRRYKALHRALVGDYFFKETEDLVGKLCDDFEHEIRVSSSEHFKKTIVEWIVSQLGADLKWIEIANFVANLLAEPGNQIKDDSLNGLAAVLNVSPADLHTVLMSLDSMNKPLIARRFYQVVNGIRREIKIHEIQEKFEMVQGDDGLNLDSSDWIEWADSVEVVWIREP